MLEKYLSLELADLRAAADRLEPHLAAGGCVYLQAEALLTLADMSGRLEYLAQRMQDVADGKAASVDTSVIDSMHGLRQDASEAPQPANGPTIKRRCL